MAKKQKQVPANNGQLDLFNDWLVPSEPIEETPVTRVIDAVPASVDEARHLLALRLAQHLTDNTEITSKLLTEEANRAFGGSQADGTYLSKDAYDALEAAVNLHLLGTEDTSWTSLTSDEASAKAVLLTDRIQRLPTQTRRDDEMDEFQQFSTPPALSFVANWVANVDASDTMAEPSAGTGDLAVWSMIAGAQVVLNELAPRRHALLAAIFPRATLFMENAEQFDNVLPTDIRPSVVVMNPPFSSTAGRVQGQRDTANGARHIEQALRRLDDGGRLVAVVGNGMAADRPAFRKWWNDIESKYNVRANIGISGREYAKYGTTFDNQILVIDKNGRTTEPVLTGMVQSVSELPALLEGIRNDRKRLESTLTQPASVPDTGAIQDHVQSGDGTRGIGIGEDRPRTESSGNGQVRGTGTPDSETHGPTSHGDVTDDGIGAGDRVSDGTVGGLGGSGGSDTRGNSGVSTSNITSPTVTSKKEKDHLFDVLLTTLVLDKDAAKVFTEHTGVIVGTANETDSALKQWRKAQSKLPPAQRFNVLEFIPEYFQKVYKAGPYAENSTSQTSNQTDVKNSPGNIAIETTSVEKTEFTDSVFANYSPQRLSISGARQHPGKLVQSAAMSAVEPPTPTYSPVLPSRVIEDGLLSIAQLEAIVYAGQAHSARLPNESRRGFFIGDGTGVGKGREISGIILDNMMQGRTKAVWVSFNEGLIEDARRDFSGVGGDPSKIFFQGKTKAGAEITQKEGILFTTYSTLRGGEKKQANDLGQKGGKTRAQQIIDWLGEEFDGVIAFDEAHSMGNAIAIRGKRGVRKPSQQAIAGINLQKALPNARVTYVSATGATEISNLSYADRLGLWGEGTPFADTNAFIGEVAKGGIASMELISRDMKSMGMYLARSLSYDGVSYERLEHTLSGLQEDIYNELAGAWQIVLNNVEQALEITQAGKNGSGKSAALSQFWGAHQRFFNQIITAMQTPRVIDDIREQLSAGHAAVIQIVNTNEAAQERIIAEATANNEALEDLDFTPRQMLMDYVRNGFPVAAYEETTDEQGNTVYQPVKDSDGNPVFDREAIRLRDALLENLQHIRVPENPLDSIINAFGADRVAEITGRSRRFVQERGDDGEYRVKEEKRGKNSSRHDAEAFQADKKDILVFSGAGGTGYSFHADNTADNKRKRIHYILQPGWRADAAVQGFGRTHRTNQAQEPHYVLPTTNLKAQKRFISSIARRLDQLGALTRGQREATSQGMFTASDNLESDYARIALKNFFGDLYNGRTPLSFHDVTKQMGLNLLDENATLSESRLPDIPQFLNRLLSLKTGMQNSVFDEFEHRLVEAVEYAKQRGIYDVGLQTLTAKSIVKTRDDVAHEDERTGAVTRYVELAVTNDIEYWNWNDTERFKRESTKDKDVSGWYVAEFGKTKGEVFYLSDIGERLNPEGKSVHRAVVHTIRKNHHRYVDNADDLARGYDYRTLNGTYQRVELTRAISEAEAERLWKEQVANAPTTETETERMVVGVILPIWDRVEGSEKIYRLQTDDGEQLLGRMLGQKAAKQTLKNLGLDSGVANLSASELFSSIQQGKRGILSNGWEIALAKVNFENRIEIKGRSSFTDAEKRLLKEQGAFSERINWVDRVFIPNGAHGLPIFERITASKPVVDLLERKQTNDDPVEDDQDIQHGVPESAPSTISVSADRSVSDSVSDDTPPQHNGDEPRREVTSMADSTTKRPYYEVVAENLIKQLEEGTAPWQRPWEPGASGSFVPFNPITGTRYKGINALYLMSQDRDDQRWMTYKQAAAQGAQVRKGEKGTGIQYWKFTEERTAKDDAGNVLHDADGEPLKVVVKLERPKVFFATVFNAEQIDGLPPLEKKEQTWDPIERAERILTASSAAISHNGGGRAFYRPSTDSIHLPDRGQFPSADNYYSTALHELGHWTGHESRLNRDMLHPFGSEAYAKEELRAEISSLLMGDELGIGHDPSQHAAYVQSWIKVLRDDPMEIFRAAADAEKIQTHLLGLEQQYIQEQENTQGQQQTVDIRMPHEMTLSVFSQQAVVEALPASHGRKWNVVLDDRYSAFSDADTHDGAIADVHRGAVNNALYLNTQDGATSSIPRPSLPPADVLADYPDLVNQYPDAGVTVANTPTELTTAEYQRAKDADAAYQSELVRVYGEKNAGDARYQLKHDDVAVQAAADEYRDASKKWQEALAAARKTLAADVPSQNTPEETMTAYQVELARLLKESSLTPGVYQPSDAVKRATHAAVFAGNTPVILTGEASDPLSVEQATSLANSSLFANTLRTAGITSELSSGVIAGNQIAWHQDESAIVDKESGEVVYGSAESGELVAIVLHDPHQAITTHLCVSTETARIFDPNVPELDDGVRLSVLARSESQARDSDARKAIESTNDGLLAVPKDALDAVTAKDVVTSDVASFRQIKNKDERRLAAIAIGHSASEQAAYRAELQQQDALIAKEAETAFHAALVSVPIDTLPTADLSALGPIAEHIAETRRRADQIDITKEIEKLAFDGLTATQIAQALEDRISPVAGDGLLSFVRQVRTSLGIPPSDSTRFEAWRDSVSTRLSAADADSTSLPRLDVSVLGDVGDVIDRARDIADRLGLTADIEKMAFDGMTATGIANAIESRIDNNTRQEIAGSQESPMAVVYFVRQVRTSLGVPPNDDVEAFARWQNDVRERIDGQVAAEYLKAAEFAREHEEAVKSDPNSTQEDIATAREQRKTADLAATVNDTEFKRKASEFAQQSTGSEKSSTTEQDAGRAADNERIYLNVPYREKNDAKALGAKWDRGQQSWFIAPTMDQSKFAKWMPKPEQQLPSTAATTTTTKPDTAPVNERQYLAVPYNERNLAKAAGARWDAGAKSWYAGPNADLGKLKTWLPDNVKNTQDPAMSPREEFAEALRELGCVVDGDHPVMDGKKQRIATVGDKAGEKAGFYVAHSDGHPAGYVINNRTGNELRWKSKGYSLTDEEKAKLNADAAIKLQQREVERVEKQESVAQSVRTLLAVAQPAPADHKYLQSKHVRAGDLRVVPNDASQLPDDSNILIGKDWKESMALREANPDKLVFTGGDLLLSANDINGDIQSVQSIQENGMKRFVSGGAKTDMFHIVGGDGMAAIANAPAIVVGEGYATADTLSQSLGYATVAAFDSGNLPHVAQKLRDQFPDKPIIIAGDNDAHLEMTEGSNRGKVKALDAAARVGGTALIPVFAPGEQSYPSNLQPVTPEKAKVRDISEEQQAALDYMKNYTDFNDLATKSRFGMAGVDRQVREMVNEIVDRHNQEQVSRVNSEKQQQLDEKLVQRNENRRGIAMR